MAHHGASALVSQPAFGDNAGSHMVAPARRGSASSIGRIRMSDFRQVSDGFWASPQIDLDDVCEARARGFALIVNNRPEGEAEDQVPGPEIAAAAEAAGMSYIAIPVTHAGFSQEQVDSMAEALADAQGPVLAYCRSGTRSTLLWSLAQAKLGRDPDAIAADAAGAGYDVTPIRGLLEMLAAGARG